MSQKALLRRFKAELRERTNIFSGATVVVCDQKERSGNIKILRLLLEQVFDDRFELVMSSRGLVVGSRNEYQATQLSNYTKRTTSKDMILTSLTKQELEHYYLQATGKKISVFVPSTPEQEFLNELADSFPSVRYGL